MERFLTKAMTIVALACFLVVGAAATSILVRDSVPTAPSELASASAVQLPVSNKEGKKDRLAIVSHAVAAFEPPRTTAALSEPLRQAYASTAPADTGLPDIVAPATAPVAAPAAAPAPPKPKAAAKPQPQKNYALARVIGLEKVAAMI